MRRILWHVGRALRQQSLSEQPVRALGVAASSLSKPVQSPGLWWNQHSSVSALAQAQAQPEAVADVQLTDNAIQKIRQLIPADDQETSLRVTVEAGGCSGFSYKFDLDKSTKRGDRVFEDEGAKIIVDAMSYEFLRGAKVDYSQELIKSAFEVIDNPNADKGCGCGTSFSPK